MIDRVVLHGVPYDDPGTRRMHPVHPYDGEPKPTVELPMRHRDGAIVKDKTIVFFYLHTDADDLPHYRSRGT